MADRSPESSPRPPPEAETPIGMEIGTVAHQADSVTTAVSGFIVSLVEAIVIVIGVLIVAMGLRVSLGKENFTRARVAWGIVAASAVSLHGAERRRRVPMAVALMGMLVVTAAATVMVMTPLYLQYFAMPVSLVLLSFAALMGWLARRPGSMFDRKTSAFATTLASASTACGSARSRARERLPRLSIWKWGATGKSVS